MSNLSKLQEQEQQPHVSIGVVTIHDACPAFSTKIFELADILEGLNIKYNIALVPFFNEKQDLPSFPEFVDKIKSYKFLSLSWAQGVKCENSKNVIQGEGLIVGTNHEDFIQGSTLDDQIFGKDMPDIIFADLGIDRVYGGAGGDTIQGGPGNDQIFGEGGDDNLFGGFDDDLIVGGEGSDHLFGDIGNDVLVGGSGADYFDCGDGIDIITDFKPNDGDVTAGNCEIF